MYLETFLLKRINQPGDLNTSPSGLSDIDPVQRQIFEALKLELPTKDRLETSL